MYKMPNADCYIMNNIYSLIKANIAAVSIEQLEKGSSHHWYGQQHFYGLAYDNCMEFRGHIFHQHV